MSNSEKPALKPANDNPWYCLATVHGEQSVDQIDTALSEKNRLFWLRWIDGNVNDQNLQKDINDQFIKRTSGKLLSLPDPAARADFSHTHFDRAVDFNGFAFRKLVDFTSSKFSRLTLFGAHFQGYARFHSSTFVGRTDFTRAIFAGAEFEAVEFFSKVDFEYTNFTQDIHFNKATFYQPTYFNHSTFRGRASFEATRFSAIVSFGTVQFIKRASFRGASFSSASFRAAEFSGAADFSYASFSISPEFINAEFKASTTFANARFEHGVPDFRGAKLHQATEWHDASWPPPPNAKSVAQDQVYAYERLKREMEQLKKHEDEQKFFRKELRARRGLARVLSGEWFLNFAYQVSSDYGSSVGRPIALLAALFAIGVYVFSGMPLTAAAINLDAIPHAVAISFANIIPVVPTTHDIASATHAVVGMSRIEKVVGVTQTLLGVPLLFLLGLALRNRFRMK
jgi:uncharacterized protein YjbI with pentapeptide repeats